MRNCGVRVYVENPKELSIVCREYFKSELLGKKCMVVKYSKSFSYPTVISCDEEEVFFVGYGANTISFEKVNKELKDEKIKEILS